MARSRDKKALYEVIKESHKLSPDKKLEKPSQEEFGEEQQQSPAKIPACRQAKWLNKPRIVQFNFGRIDISISYPLAVALLLGLILLILVAFRLGQISGPEPAESTSKAPQGTRETAFEAGINRPQRAAPVEERASMPLFAAEAEPVTPKGDNRIVIQTYQVRTDLEPVKRYFAGFGIDTEIVKIGDWYYLVTTDKYENPEKQGTDGYSAKQRIIELGAGYKAPPGYETFGSKPFRDAYGMKFSE